MGLETRLDLKILCGYAEAGGAGVLGLLAV